MKSASDQHVTLCGKKLHGLRHICAFFESDDEMYEILNPYLKEGIDVGDQVVTIMESNLHPHHRNRLQSAGIDVAGAVKRDQLKVVASEDSYLKDGIFAVERMYQMLEQAVIGAEQSEFKHLRTLGDMEWALHGCPGTEDLMTYEARVNQLTPHHDCTLLCAYDINKFSGRVITDVLSTHSHVLLGGQIYENPHFVDPVVYLSKLALRRKSTSTSREEWFRTDVRLTHSTNLNVFIADWHWLETGPDSGTN